MLPKFCDFQQFSQSFAEDKKTLFSADTIVEFGVRIFISHKKEAGYIGGWNALKKLSPRITQFKCILFSFDEIPAFNRCQITIAIVISWYKINKFSEDAIKSSYPTDYRFSFPPISIIQMKSDEINLDMDIQESLGLVFF